MERPAVRSRVLCSLSVACAFALSGCATPSQQQPQAAAVSCDGRPNWCVLAANQLNDTATVYIDGIARATLRSGGSAQIPVGAGESHVVNSCHEVFVGLLRGGWNRQCTPPRNTTFYQNYSLVIGSW
jgi:hypothetical protein